VRKLHFERNRKLYENCREGYGSYLAQLSNNGRTSTLFHTLQQVEANSQHFVNQEFKNEVHLRVLNYLLEHRTQLASNLTDEELLALFFIPVTKAKDLEKLQRDYLLASDASQKRQELYENTIKHLSDNAL